LVASWQLVQMGRNHRAIAGSQGPRMPLTPPAQQRFGRGAAVPRWLTGLTSMGGRCGPKMVMDGHWNISDTPFSGFIHHVSPYFTNFLLEVWWMKSLGNPEMSPSFLSASEAHHLSEISVKTRHAVQSWRVSHASKVRTRHSILESVQMCSSRWLIPDLISQSVNKINQIKAVNILLSGIPANFYQKSLIPSKFPGCCQVARPGSSAR